MSADSLSDYLHTQGLKLPHGDVQAARLWLETVIRMAEAEIDRSVLWYADAAGALADRLPENADNHTLLRAAYLALDALLSRYPATAAVYLLHPEHGLVRLAAQGLPLPAVFAPEQTEPLHPAVRSAQTGWLGLVDNIGLWRGWGDWPTGHDNGAQSCIALPVYGEDGRVLGVLYAEHADTQAFDAERQSAWVGLAFALLPLLQQWHHTHPPTEEHHE
ncbi:hypothetical protein L1281_002303 [Neisseria sp. HSC-16F19]|nr:GAF domain-containing protein [Neisseria sp. HSC-16F19]MCP2041692.1 hypothetical protein [Neisseria sp. HSC-16F19]